jgi:hypothetical protein
MQNTATHMVIAQDEKITSSVFILKVGNRHAFHQFCTLIGWYIAIAFFKLNVGYVQLYKQGFFVASQTGTTG